MIKKENQRIALTRRLLQEGLLRLLATEKMEHISVTALCKEAGINRATFYNHYTSPTALLQEMEQELISKLQHSAGPAANLEEVKKRTEACLILLREHASLVHILVTYHADRDLEELVAQAARYYDSHRLNKLQTELDPDTAHLVSSYLYSGCYNLIREWLVRDIDKTPKEITELLINIINKDYL